MKMKKIKIIPVKWIPDKHDTDGDGVPNYKDCVPWDSKRQHFKPFGVYSIGNNRYAVYQQQLMGAGYVKRGKPLFVGTEYEAKQFINQIPVNPESYDAETSIFER